ncbi:MAG: hypothetical protein QME07_00595 [bacterium]|nr:hypothetical protein [bacterium]
MEEGIRIFLADLEAQSNEIRKIAVSVEKKAFLLREKRSDEDLTNSLAYKLHNLYSAYEDMFKLIISFFENQIEGVAKYHIDLLKRMLVKIEGIRPNLLSEESFKILDEMRGFRHLFRHAYGYYLEPERVMELAERSIRLFPIFESDFKAFKKALLKEAMAKIS